VLVTSWFRTLHAPGCIRAVSPTIRWMSAPAEQEKSLLALAQDREGMMVTKEYLKLAWYALRHGVDSTDLDMTAPAAEPAPGPLPAWTQ